MPNVRRLSSVAIVVGAGLVALILARTLTAQPIPQPGLQRVAHDSSLTGSGTTVSPIGVRTAVGGGLVGGGAQPLSLLPTCTDTQTLAWGSAGSAWACATGGGGGGLSAVSRDAPLTGSGSAGSHLAWTSCPSGNGYIDVSGTTWTCENIATAVGTNLTLSTSATGGSVGLNLPGSTCTGGQAVTSVTSAGATTCGAVGNAGTITSVTCGTGLSCTAANPIVASGTITLNEAGASCSAGSAVSAISATGTGTCTAFGNVTSGTLTSGTMPVASGAGALANSGTTDNGTTITFGATATTITRASGAFAGAASITAAGIVQASSGQTYLSGSSVNFLTGTNAAATGKINALGFNGGVTQFRSLDVEDGKGSSICLFTGGATEDMTCAGTATITGVLTTTAQAAFNGGATVGVGLTMSGNNIVGIGDSTQTGHQRFTGTTPAVSACGASPSIATGSSDEGGIITFGAATTTTCSYTFATTWSPRAPFCTCSNAGTASTEPFTFCTASTTTLTINATAATNAGVFAYHCSGS